MNTYIPTHSNRWRSILGASLVAALCVAGPSSDAHASRMNDWQCLTDDLSGNDVVRQQYISASRFASGVFDIAPSILVAIKRVESGRGLNPMVVGHNTNGTTDRGFYQVNADFWLPVLKSTGAKLQIRDLHGIKENALIAAWVLRRQMNRRDVGNTLKAVGYYHKGGGTSSRANRIRKTYTDTFMKELRGMMARCG